MERPREPESAATGSEALKPVTVTGVSLDADRPAPSEDSSLSRQLSATPETRSQSDPAQPLREPDPQNLSHDQRLLFEATNFRGDLLHSNK